MEQSRMNLGPRSAVVVDSDVWNGGRPILWLVWEASEEPADSGWTIGCAREPRGWIIVSLEEVVQRDNTVNQVIFGQFGKRVYRDNFGDPWKIDTV